MRCLLAGLVALLSAGSIQAADLTIELRTSDGRPVEGAVASYRPAGAPAARAVAGQAYTVAQRDVQFAPRLLIVPVGATVTFPNRDKVRHHVYSFSPAKRFELKLYGREEMRSVVFDKPGVIALGCNIHDAMSGHIVVVDTPFAAKSDAQGRVVLTGAPPTAGVLTIWHPALKTPGSTLSRQIRLPADARQLLTLALRDVAAQR